MVVSTYMEVVSLSLELCRGVHLVSHDTGDSLAGRVIYLVKYLSATIYLFNILHPLGHLLVAHVIDILDEVVVLLPEGHDEGGGSAE